MKIKILVVEDDKHIRETVTAYLLEAEYQVDTCSDGDSALERFYDTVYHLVILDIMLPGVNGHELLGLRKNFMQKTLLLNFMFKLRMARLYIKPRMPFYRTLTILLPGGRMSYGIWL